VVATIGSDAGGMVGLEHADGPLLNEVSPSKPDWSEMLVNYAIAFAAIGAASAVVGLLARRRRARTDRTPDEDAHTDGPEPDEEPE
jgi:hypothetical protein